MDHRIQALDKFIKSHCPSATSVDMICGDASFRRYFRFQADGVSYIGVDAPVETEDTPLFMALALALNESGILVPKVLASDLKQGFMWQTDLGDTLLAGELNEQNVVQHYQACLGLLDGVRAVSSEQIGLPSYNTEMLHFELSIFCEWLLEKWLGLTLSLEQQKILAEAFEVLVDNMLSQPQVTIHRDFHGRNIMLSQQHYALIDFQGAVKGPIGYDPVSLLKDCYQKWPAKLMKQVLVHHHQHLVNEGQIEADFATFSNWVDVCGIQRHLKAAGIFCRLLLRDSKAIYIKDIPRTLSYIVDANVSSPKVGKLQQWIKEEILPMVEQKIGH